MPQISGIKFFQVVHHSFFRIEINIELHFVKMHTSSFDGGL